MWFGDEHVRNPTRQNADITQFWYGNNRGAVVKKAIKAGTYYPIRVLWGNTEGAGYLNLDIFGPDGQRLTKQGKQNGSYLLTQPCGGGGGGSGGSGGNGGPGGAGGPGGGALQEAAVVVTSLKLLTTKSQGSERHCWGQPKCLGG